jgi:hypothetical protein
MASVFEPGPEILELVNQARRELRMPTLKELPRGTPETSRQCVLGRSLDVEVLTDDHDGPFALVQQYRRACVMARVWGVGRPRAVWNGWAIDLPAALTRFVREFDARCYPQLVSDLPAPSPESIRSELRALRFDWIAENARVDDLLRRARLAHDHAEIICNVSRTDQKG